MRGMSHFPDPGQVEVRGPYLPLCCPSKERSAGRKRSSPTPPLTAMILIYPRAFWDYVRLILGSRNARQTGGEGRTLTPPGSGPSARNPDDPEPRPRFSLSAPRPRPRNPTCLSCRNAMSMWVARIARRGVREWLSARSGGSRKALNESDALYRSA